MKIIAIGDFHGVFPEELKERVVREKPDYIFSVGDYSNSDEYRKIIFKNWQKLKSKSIPEIIGKKKYNKIMKRRKESGVSVLKELDGLGIKVFSVTGNGESHQKFNRKEIEEIFKDLRNVELLYNRTKEIGGREQQHQQQWWQVLAICSYRGASSKQGHYQGVRKKLKYFYINKRWDFILKSLFSKMKNNQKTILMAHEPPRDTKLDLISYKKSPMYGEHLGDEYFRKYVEKYQPRLMVCGHFHENQGKDMLGDTLIVNPGPAKEGKAAIIELGKKIKVRFIK